MVNNNTKIQDISAKKQASSRRYRKIACLYDDKSKPAIQAYEALQKKYRFVNIEDKPNVILVLGGDGFMLHSLHDYLGKNIPFYGMNCGTVGFLMNEYSDEDLQQRLAGANKELLYPLGVQAVNVAGESFSALAINEVSLLRETRQAANLQVSVDGKTRIKDLICDGIMVATPAGSTAYNFSAHGPIVPLGSNLLALTPISPFRPRRWRGALLPHKAQIEIRVKQAEKRPVSTVADFTEFRDVKSVFIEAQPERKIKLLFDPGHSLEERIVSEQFIF